MAEATFVPSALVPSAWPALLPLIEAACKHSAGQYRAEHVREKLERDEWQLWTDGASIACTSIVEYPARRMLYVTLAAGSLDGVGSIWPALEGFAVANGCGAIQWRGRPGWSRCGTLPPNAKLTHEIMTVELG